MTVDDIKALKPTTEEGEKLRDQMLAAVDLLVKNGWPTEHFDFGITPRLRAEVGL